MDIGICFGDLFVSRVDRGYETIPKGYRRYEELNCRIRQLTGFDIWQLELLFSKGFTLVPPQKYTPLSELVEDLSDSISERRTE